MFLFDGLSEAAHCESALAVESLRAFFTPSNKDPKVMLKDDIENNISPDGVRRLIKITKTNKYFLITVVSFWHNFCGEYRFR